MLLVVDNHDSFTWNLVHLLSRFAEDTHVVQCDEVTLEDVRLIAPRAIVLTPGPGRPEQAGIGIELVRTLGGVVPLFGVCLGHQIICAAFGARVVHARALMHGRTSHVRHDGEGIFAGLPTPLEVARYHSLAVDPSSLPPALRATAFSEDGELMAVRHATLPIESVQFHPESFMTAQGSAMIARFLAAVPPRSPAEIAL